MVNLIEVVASEGHPYYKYVIFDHSTKLAYYPVHEERTQYNTNDMSNHHRANIYERQYNSMTSAIFKIRLFWFDDD